MGAVAQRAGDAAPLIGPAVAAYNAPEGGKTQAAGNSFGNGAISSVLGAIHPVLGLAASLFGGNMMNTLSQGQNYNGGAPATSSGHGNLDNLVTGLAGLYQNNKNNSILKQQANSLSGMY